MKKSELRKLIREILQEQSNGQCYYCLSTQVDTGVGLVGSGIVQGESYMDALQSTQMFGPNNCITETYGYNIGTNGGPMFGTFNPAIVDSCQYNEEDIYGWNCRPGHISGTSKCVPGTPQNPGTFNGKFECEASGCEEQQNVGPGGTVPWTSMQNKKTIKKRR